MDKHTAGPWQAYEIQAGEGADAWWFQGPDFVPPCDEDGEPCMLSRADAHLIAAAPDLLTALQLLSSAVSMAGTPMHEKADMRVVAKVVVAALRKATGDRAAAGWGE